MSIEVRQAKNHMPLRACRCISVQTAVMICRLAVRDFFALANKVGVTTFLAASQAGPYWPWDQSQVSRSQRALTAFQLLMLMLCRPTLNQNSTSGSSSWADLSLSAGMFRSPDDSR